MILQLPNSLDALKAEAAEHYNLLRGVELIHPLQHLMLRDVNALYSRIWEISNS